MFRAEDNFTTTVDGAAAHAAGFARFKYDINHDPYDYIEHEGVHGICNECGEECDSVCLNEYENNVSPCCEAEVVEGGNTLIREDIHVANKHHSFEIGCDEVRVGDKYKLSVYRFWRKDGPKWIRVYRKRLNKGSNWEV